MSDDWTQYSKLVLSELEKHGEKLEKMSEQLGRHGEELAQLKVKAGMWGAVAGAVIGVTSYIMNKVG
ncbi:MAG: hypothetical protein CMM02_16205 [Rhodopirellula sp.]|nr:hypothetical protein [Rhodopirellula sp.]